MAEVMKMDADLVRPAAVQRAFQQAHLGTGAQDAIFRFRRAALPAARCSSVAGAPDDGRWLVDHAARFPRDAGHQREINFLHRARGKLPGKIAMGRIVFGHDQAAAGFLVEAMNDARTFFPADAG